MDPVTPLLVIIGVMFGGLIIGASVYGTRISRQERERAISEVIERLDIKVVEQGKRTLKGEIDGVRVELFDDRVMYQEGTSMIVSGFRTHATFPNVSFTLTDTDAMVPRDAVDGFTGDGRFDSTFAAYADHAEVCAVLDADCRNQLVEASSMIYDSQISFAPDGIHFKTFEPIVTREELQKLFKLLVTLHKAMERAAPAMDVALVRQVTEDSSRGARRRAARLLLDRRLSPAALKELDASDSLNAQFVRAWHDRNGDLLVKLATEERLHDELVGLLVELEDSPIDAEDRRRLLPRLLTRKGDVRLAALRALAHEPVSSAFDECVKLVTSLHDDTAAAAAKVLERIGDSRAESVLITALDRGPIVQVAAADALAKCGTRLAVGPLLQLTKGVLGDRDVRRAAQAAIDRIQGTLTTGAAGGLAVVDQTHRGVEGGLSHVSRAGAGDLAFAEEDATQTQAVAHESEESA